MSSDLEALKAALTRQLDTIDLHAQSVGVPREQLMTTNGGYVAAPVIVALANVEIALLAQPQAVRAGCETWSPRSYVCTLDLGHDGPHIAQGSHDEVIDTWETPHA